jgi:hypothetical protein
VLLPAAAGFIQGFGSALGQGSSSVVTNGTTTIVQQSGKGIQQGAFQGLAQTGQTLGQFFEEQANQTQPLVRVAAGTPMGLFFISSVCSFTECQNQSPDSPVPPTSNYSTNNGFNNNQFGNGYNPNTPMNGYGYNAQMPGMNNFNGATSASLPYPGANVPYPNVSMPYNGQALTNPNNTVLPNYGSNYTNTTPNTYGIGTPLVNP